MQQEGVLTEVAPAGGVSMKRRASLKRVEEWTTEDSKRELAKYCRAEQVDSPLALCDPLVELVLQERQTSTLRFVRNMGATMDRYSKWNALATEHIRGFYDRHDVNEMLSFRGRLIRLPVDVLEEGGETNKADGEEDDDDSTTTTSSSDSSTPIEASADAPRLPPLNNAVLLQHLETLMCEARNLDMDLVQVQEWFTLNVPSYTATDEDSLEIVAKLVEEVGEAREVASDRYDFYSTYLEVRAELESNAQRYPDVQSYRELMVARDHAAWEELIRSWGLLLSALATLNVTLSQNLKYVVAENDDDNVHDVTESNLFM